MNVNKSEVLELLDHFPEQVEIEELIHRLCLLEKDRREPRDVCGRRGRVGRDGPAPVGQACGAVVVEEDRS